MTPAREWRPEYTTLPPPLGCLALSLRVGPILLMVEVLVGLR